MNRINKTLYIPLYGKAYVSKRGIILRDKRAEEIWDAEGFDLKGRSASKWLAYFMGMRSAVFDEWTRSKISKDCTIIHVGCGMDSRVLRVNTDALWYDVDFPDVIAQRKLYFSQNDTYKMIGCDITNQGLSDIIPQSKRAVIVMEGVSMYLKPEELKALFHDICSHFEHVSLLTDCYTEFGARMSRHRNPINDVGVTTVYGLDRPESLNTSDLAFIAMHDMTPQKYIDELSGAERFIFKRLYAGKLSKKLYRIYEYEK